MKVSGQLLGLKSTIARQKAWVRSVYRRIPMALKRAGLRLARESLKIVPVDTGYLKASWFVRHTGNMENTVVFVGYTASYAIYVHENLENAHGRAYNEKHADKIAAGAVGPDGRKYHRRGENQQAKFLSDPAKTHRKTLQQIFRETIGNTDMSRS